MAEPKPVEITGLNELVAAMAEQTKMMGKAFDAISRRP
jgi:hypothetical protein